MSATDDRVKGQKINILNEKMCFYVVKKGLNFVTN